MLLIKYLTLINLHNLCYKKKNPRTQGGKKKCCTSKDLDMKIVHEISKVGLKYFFLSREMLKPTFSACERHKKWNFYVTFCNAANHLSSESSLFFSEDILWLKPSQLLALFVKTEEHFLPLSFLGLAKLVFGQAFFLPVSLTSHVV